MNKTAQKAVFYISNLLQLAANIKERKMKKAIVVMMILAVITASVFAQAAAEKAEEEKVVTIIQDATFADKAWFAEMNADFEAETGIHVEAQFSASSGNDFNQKMIIDLMGGSDVDVIPMTTFRYYTAEMEGDFLAPLSQYIDNAKEIWGGFLTIEEDGDFYAVPTKSMEPVDMEHLQHRRCPCCRRQYRSPAWSGQHRNHRLPQW